MFVLQLLYLCIKSDLMLELAVVPCMRLRFPSVSVKNHWRYENKLE